MKCANSYEGDAICILSNGNLPISLISPSQLYGMIMQVKKEILRLNLIMI